MADNVAITAGAGTSIAADDVSSVFYQRVKLDAGGNGVSLPVLGGGGVEADALRVTIASDSTGVLTVDNGGTFPVQVDGAALTALQLIDDCISGSEAQVDVVAALPAGANNIGTVAPYAQPASFVSGATGDITTTSATSVIAAQGAGVVTYVTSIMVTNGDATVGTFVNITDGSGGTVLWTGYAAAGGGGFSVTFPTPLKFTSNTAVYAACVTDSATVRVCAAGYKV